MNYGCTTYTVITGSKLLFGRNLDVDSDIGYIFCNPRNMSKTAYLPVKSSEIPVKWTSKYGSISFNQIALDIPHGGMNEEGFVVEHLFLAESKYERADERPVLISHQWVQYVLDNCKNIDEAIAIQSQVRISARNFKFPIHFHLMDKYGNRAIFEFLDGQCKIYNGSNYTIGVLANSTYENSIESSQGYERHIQSPTDLSTSIHRFNKVSKLIEHIPDTNNILPFAFSVLDSVINGTKWQIVYDLEHLEIHYRTESNNQVQLIRMGEFNFLDETPTYHSINTICSDSSNWNAITMESNKEIIKGICESSEFINSILGDELDEIAVFPFR